MIRHSNWIDRDLTLKKQCSQVFDKEQRLDSHGKRSKHYTDVFLMSLSQFHFLLTVPIETLVVSVGSEECVLRLSLLRQRRSSAILCLTQQKYIFGTNNTVHMHCILKLSKTFSIPPFFRHYKLVGFFETVDTTVSPCQWIPDILASIFCIGTFSKICILFTQMRLNLIDYAYICILNTAY